MFTAGDSGSSLVRHSVVRRLYLSRGEELPLPQWTQPFLGNCIILFGAVFILKWFVDTRMGSPLFKLLWLISRQGNSAFVFFGVQGLPPDRLVHCHSDEWTWIPTRSALDSDERLPYTPVNATSLPSPHDAKISKSNPSSCK